MKKFDKKQLENFVNGYTHSRMRKSTQENIIEVLYEFQNSIEQLNNPVSKSKIDRVLSAVTAVTGYTLEQLQEKQKVYYRAIIRQIAMFILHSECHLKSTEIGLLLKRDHSTALHSIKKVYDYINLKRLYQREFETYEMIMYEFNKGK